MNNTAASRDASNTVSATELLHRLSQSHSGNAVLDGLARINQEIELQRLASQLRAEDNQELRGLGTSFAPRQRVHVLADDRATHVAPHMNRGVQGAPLHGAVSTDEMDIDGSAKARESRCFAGIEDIIAMEGCTVVPLQTVHPLSDKNSKNNSCTVGSSSLTAARVATEVNAFASPPPARFAHQDNQPCTASAPPPPSQEENEESCEDTTPEPALEKLELGYCRCDFFDNGAAKSGGAKPARSRARYKVNAFLGLSRGSHKKFCIAFPTEGRFFKRSIPAGHDLFYTKVWGQFEEMRRLVRQERLAMEIRPLVAHLKDSNNHVVPEAAAILFKEEGEPVDIILFLGGSVFPLQLDKSPKGSKKCAALKGMGYWNPREK